MATLAVGAVVSVYCPLSGTVTVTPGTSGRVSINARGRDGSQSLAPRELYSAETFTVSAGDVVGLEAINAAATYTDPAESGPALQALVSVAGNRSRAAYQSSAYLDALGWLRPRHRPLLNPETYSAGGISAAAGVVASIAAAGAAEFQRSDLVFTMAGVTTEGNTDVPLFADFYGKYPVAGFRLHFRINCSDWTKVSALRFYLVEDKATYSARYQMSLVDAGISEVGCTDPGMSAAWNGVYRTISVSGDRRFKNGTPAAYASGGTDPETFTTQAFRIRIATTGACVIKINRIYSPIWPVGMIGLIGDHGQKTFRDLVSKPLEALGYNTTLSLLQRFEDAGDPYPSAADIAEHVRGGGDFIPHLRSLTAATAFAGTETAAEIELSGKALLRRLADAGVGARGANIGQFLQNIGKSNTGASIFMAQELARLGIVMTRGDTADSQFGCNPHATTYTARLSGYKPVSFTYGTNWGSPVGYTMGWTPERGRYNLGVAELFQTDTVYFPSSPTNRDTYAGSPVQSMVDKCSAYKDAQFLYTHAVVPYDGTEPTIYNTGTNQWAALKSDLLSKVAAGNLVLLSMSQFRGLTYGRQDDIYLRWDGEWCNRTDDAIAF